MEGALMSVSDRILLRKRAIIETVNDELKNIAQVEHSRHRCFDNFIVNLLGTIAAYCLFPKKPCINVQRTIDTQLALFWIRRTHVNLLKEVVGRCRTAVFFVFIRSAGAERAFFLFLVVRRAPNAWFSALYIYFQPCNEFHTLAPFVGPPLNSCKPVRPGLP